MGVYDADYAEPSTSARRASDCFDPRRSSGCGSDCGCAACQCRIEQYGARGTCAPQQGIGAQRWVIRMGQPVAVAASACSVSEFEQWVREREYAGCYDRGNYDRNYGGGGGLGDPRYQRQNEPIYQEIQRRLIDPRSLQRPRYQDTRYEEAKYYDRSEYDARYQDNRYRDDRYDVTRYRDGRIYDPNYGNGNYDVARYRDGSVYDPRSGNVIYYDRSGRRYDDNYANYIRNRQYGGGGCNQYGGGYDSRYGRQYGGWNQGYGGCNTNFGGGNFGGGNFGQQILRGVIQSQIYRGGGYGGYGGYGRGYGGYGMPFGYQTTPGGAIGSLIGNAIFNGHHRR